MTDFNVLGENILKKQKKNGKKLVEKKSTAEGDSESEVSKRRSNKTDISSKTTKTSNTINPSQALHSINSASLQSFHHDLTNSYSLSSSDLQIIHMKYFHFNGLHIH